MGHERDDLVQLVCQGRQRLRVHESERGGQSVGHTRLGSVGIGVRRVQRDAVSDEGVHRAPLGCGRGHRVDAAQQQRVMGEEQVGAPVDGLLDHGRRRVDGQEHPMHRRFRVAAHQSDGVPRLRPRGWVAPRHGVHHVGDGEHETRA